MKLDQISDRNTDTTVLSLPARFANGLQRLRPWLFSWEIYLILLVAAFLRFYRIDTTEFDDDQATLFRMAHDAITHGLLPATSNTASIGISHPPGVIYFFMLPAALSSNPVWAAVMVGIFSVTSVLLTYFFTQRYFGRLAATLAALFFATDTMLLGFGRSIWQPNFMPAFVVLFMFTLFWGAVERRKGWLFPAIVLIGLLYQMHEYALYLIVPLVVAIVLAPRTVRPRDLAFSSITLMLLLFPYLLWMVFTGFADLRAVSNLFIHKAYIDGNALRLYRLFLSPYDRLPTDPRSVVRLLSPLLSWLGIIVPLLAGCGFLVAIGSQFLAHKRERSDSKINLSPIDAVSTASSLWNRMWSWWKRYRADANKCSLLLLLVWQITPLLLLSRHANRLTWQYLLILMPGPFILIGLFLSRLTGWFKKYRPDWRIVRYGVFLLIGLTLFAQGINCLAGLIDTTQGYFSDRSFPPYPYHNDLHSLQNALLEADQLAQQRHLRKIYVTTDAATQTALRYLTEQRPANSTPMTLFDASHCLVLPDPGDGPAVLLVGPYDDLTRTLLSQFAVATLVEQPARLGDAPFKLYIVQPSTGQSQVSPGNAFRDHLQLLDMQAHLLAVNNANWLVTRWSLLHSEQRQLRTTYNYVMRASLNGNGEQRMQSQCIFTNIQAGDQLLVAFNLPPVNTLLVSVTNPSMTLTSYSFMTIPYNPWFGPFHLETNNNVNTPLIPLRTMGGMDSITLPISRGSGLSS